MNDIFLNDHDYPVNYYVDKLNEIESCLMKNFNEFGSNSPVFGAVPVCMKSAVDLADLAFAKYSNQAYFVFMKAKFLWFGHGDKSAALRAFHEADQTAKLFGDIELEHLICNFIADLNARPGVYVPMVYMNHLEKNPLLADMYSIRLWWNREADNSPLGRLLMKIHTLAKPSLGSIAAKSIIMQKLFCFFLLPVIYIARIRNQKHYFETERFN